MIDFNPYSPKSISSFNSNSIQAKSELLNIRILSLLPPPTLGSGSSSPISGKALHNFLSSLSQNTFIGTIANSGNSNSAVINSPLGKFTLDSSFLSSLSTNTKLKFQINNNNTFNIKLLSPTTSPSTNNVLNPATNPTINPTGNPAGLIGQTTFASVIQDAPLSSFLSNIIATTPNSNNITAQQLSVLRNILSSPLNNTSIPPNLDSTNSNTHAKNVAINLLDSASTKSTPNPRSSAIFQGTISSLSPPASSPTNLNATISFFGGSINLPSLSPQVFSTLSVGKSVNFSMSQNFSPSDQSIKALFLPLLNSSKPTSISTPPSPNATYTSSNASGLPTASATPQLLRGDNLPLKIISITLPNNSQIPATIPPSSSSSSSYTFTATLLPTTSSSQAHIATSPLGLISFNSSFGLPAYSKLSLSLENPPINNQERLSHAIIKTIEELFSTEQTSQTTRQITQTLIPQINSPQLTSALIFLLSAVAKGQYQQWLGTNLTNAINLKNPAQAKIIKESFANSANNKNNSKTNSKWNWSYLPIANNNAIDNLVFAYQLHEQEDNENTQDKDFSPKEHFFRISSRFSQLGLLQIEGHIQNFDDKTNSKPRNFSLMIANEPPLPKELEKNIKDIFISTSEALGFIPHIVFRKNLDPSWLSP